MNFRKLSLILFPYERVTKPFVTVACIAALSLPFYASAYADDSGVGSLAVIGDSLSAGFQNNTLIACQQVNGYANLIGNQAGANSHQILPLISFPGIPPVVPISAQGPFPGRLNPAEQPTDVAVPGQTVSQALTMVPNYNDVFFLNGTIVPVGVQGIADLVLGYRSFIYQQPPTSQVQQAIAASPHTLIVWLGSNDAIGVFERVQAQITNPVDFAKSFDQLMSAVTVGGRKVVVATVPDATLTPFMQSLNLPAATILQVRATILAYNAAIVFSAFKYGATVVDIYSYLNQLAAAGVNVAGTHLTTQAGGGIFSLDGLHPSNTGYALIANQFIAKMNSRLETQIPQVDLAAVAAADPLFPGHQPMPLCFVPPPQP